MPDQPDARERLTKFLESEQSLRESIERDAAELTRLRTENAVRQQVEALKQQVDKHDYDHDPIVMARVCSAKIQTLYDVARWLGLPFVEGNYPTGADVKAEIQRLKALAPPATGGKVHS